MLMLMLAADELLCEDRRLSLSIPRTFRMEAALVATVSDGKQTKTMKNALRVV